jgi:hypothetical protein
LWLAQCPSRYIMFTLLLPVGLGDTGTGSVGLQSRPPHTAAATRLTQGGLIRRSILVLAVVVVVVVVRRRCSRVRLTVVVVVVVCGAVLLLLLYPSQNCSATYTHTSPTNKSSTHTRWLPGGMASSGARVILDHMIFLTVILR